MVYSSTIGASRAAFSGQMWHRAKEKGIQQFSAHFGGQSFSFRILEEAAVEARFAPDVATRQWDDVPESSLFPAEMAVYAEVLDG